MSERVHVRIGEVCVKADQGVLFAIGLGSCVGVALYDPRYKVGGLAHVMLPEPPPRKTDFLRGRYAHTAIEMLVDQMIEAGARKRGMYARIVGGAAMFADVLPQEGIGLGERNVAAVIKSLGKHSIPLKAQETGGSYGRSIFLDANDGSLMIRAVRRDDIVI
jgi:chemotaxis protein CheD